MARGEKGSGSGAGEATVPVLFRISKPGSGGISRGRGDAALSFGESAEREAEFATQALPAARFAESASEQIGVAAGSPRIAPVTEAPAAGVATSAEGAPSGTRRIAPRHRDAVRTFFSAKKPPADSGGKK